MTTDALITAIQRRLTDISEQQHALAVEKARLLGQLTPFGWGFWRLTRPWPSSRRRGSRCVDCHRPHRPTGGRAPHR